MEYFDAIKLILTLQIRQKHPIWYSNPNNGFCTEVIVEEIKSFSRQWLPRRQSGSFWMGQVCVFSETSRYCSVFLCVPSSKTEGMRRSLARLLRKTRKTLHFGGYRVRPNKIGQERAISNNKITNFSVDMVRCFHATDFWIRLRAEGEDKNRLQWRFGSRQYVKPPFLRRIFWLKMESTDWRCHPLMHTISLFGACTKPGAKYEKEKVGD